MKKMDFHANVKVNINQNVHNSDILDIEKDNTRHRAVSLRPHGFLVSF